MDLNKHQCNGMKDLVTSFLSKSLIEEKLIKHFSLKSHLIIFYLCNFMWKTSFLVPLTNLFVKILGTRCRGSLNVNDRGVKLLSWSSSEANGPWSIFPSNKILQGTSQEFEMDKSKEVATPMTTNCYLSANGKGKSMDQIKFKGIIGSLLYLIACRTNIILVFACVHAINLVLRSLTSLL